MSEIEAWKHADYIYACYLIVGFCVAALTLWIVRDEHKQNLILAEMEEQGHKDKA